MGVLEEALARFRQLPQQEQSSAAECSEHNPDFCFCVLDTVGKCCMMLGELTDGIKFLSEAAALHESDPVIWNTLGQAQADGGLPSFDTSFEKACKLHESANDLIGWCCVLRNWLGARPDKIGDFQKDPATFGGGHRQRAESRFVLAAAARLAALPEANELAEEMLRAAMEESESLRLDLADKCGSLGEDPAIDEWAVKLLEATPGAEAEYRIASKHVAKGDHEAALARVSAAVTRYPRANNLALMQAQLLLAVGRHEEAQKAAETSLASGCDDLELYVVIAKVLFRQARFDDAEVTLRSFEEAAREAGDSEQVAKAQAYMEMVHSARASGNT